MTDKIRKYILPNVPYLFVMWFCLKMGTAYRLADGANIAFRLINMGITIGPALQNFAPGFIGFDWFIGLAGAALLRIIIYYKVKNAKKFRRDVEYGSARFGTAKEMKPFTDPIYKNNVILTGTEFGRCTVADGDSFSVLMEACGNNAARVLREYSYFSPELKAILEKAAAIQATQNRAYPSPGLFSEPKNSPWGEVDYCDTLCPGVYLVSTPSHGGTMVSKEIEEFLSPAARRHGQRKNGFLCYEEDSAEAIVLRELLDKKLWAVPVTVKDKAAFEERINDTLREYHPEYWRSRENGRGQAPLIKTAITHNDR